MCFAGRPLRICSIAQVFLLNNLLNRDLSAFTATRTKEAPDERPHAKFFAANTEKESHKAELYLRTQKQTPAFY